MSNEEVICKKLADTFCMIDWNKMTPFEKELTTDLEQSGWLVKKERGNKLYYDTKDIRTDV